MPGISATSARRKETTETRALLALEAAPGHLLRRCHRRSREIYEQLIGHRGVSRQQFAVLIAMAGSAGANLTRIAAATGFDRNTLAEMIDRLKRAGYVVRRRSAADARAFEIALTAKGARFVAETMPLAREVQRRILAPLAPALRPLFLRCLRILLGLDAGAPADAQDARAASARVPTGAPCTPLLPEPVRAGGGARAARAELRKLEESMWRPESRNDRDYMERTLAPEFFEFGRSGRVYTRDAIVGMRLGPALLKYALSDFKVTPLDRDVTLVTYVSEVPGKEVTRGNRSSLWRKTPEGWRLSFHQGTPVLPPGTVSD